MKKLALAFSSKDRVELSKQSMEVLADSCRYAIANLWWLDGSATPEGKQFFRTARFNWEAGRVRVIGGPDSAIVYALTQMLKDDADYIGLLENDVLLDPDWLEPTMALFDNQENLPVGAVSARSYEDRVLLQRDGYAVMHNVGAGHIIFTREAAQIVLDNYRTGWWPENRAVFSQLSGLDIGKWAAFHHNEQFITADWSWDTILAAHGLATVALTPSKATMIGQDIAEQGLRLTTGPVDVENPLSEQAFILFRDNLQRIRTGERAIGRVDHLLRTRGGSIIFPHQAEKHGGLFSGQWKTRWSQGFGPFMYVAGEDALFSIPVFGPCAFHVGGGKVLVNDVATHFSTEIDLSNQTEMVTLSVPRDMQTGIIRLMFSPGSCLAGIETVQPQPVWKDVTFDYSKLPEVE